MKAKRCMIKNEDGTILVVALLILALVSVVGVAATSSSSIEIQIAKNQKLYKQNFYRAEAAVIECAKTMESESNEDLEDRSPTYLNLLSDLANTENINDPDNWVSANTNEVIDGDNQFLVIDEGVRAGSSLDMAGAVSVHTYVIYGRSNQHNGEVLIEAGYKRRF